MSQIFYNGKTVELTDNPCKWRAIPAPLRTVTTTLIGVVETICAPRMDIRVSGEFQPFNDGNLRWQLWNWWHWACKGNAWAITLDSSRTVSTTLSAGAAAGATTVTVTSATGIVAYRRYKIWDGPNFALVYVNSVSSNTVTLAETLNVPFGSGAIFRDENYYYGALREPELDLPIIDVNPDEALGQTMPQTKFRLVLDFYEELRNLTL